MPQDAIPAITPDERAQRVAAILTQGVIRFQRRIRRTGASSDDKRSSPETCPEVPRETKLSVSRVVG
jgi:hypothetical protein